MHTPGKKYHLSNKFEKKELYKIFILILVICLPIGWLVQKFMNFLYGNLDGETFFVKVALSIICLLLSIYFSKIVVSRNKQLDFFIILATSMVSWYGFWSSIHADFSSSSFFMSLLRPDKVIMFYADFMAYTDSIALDTAAFFISIYYFFIGNSTLSIYLFCEDCKKEYASYKFYINEGKEFEESFSDNKQGNFSFIASFDFKYEETDLTIDGQKDIEAQNDEEFDEDDETLFETKDNRAYKFTFSKCFGCKTCILDINQIEKYKVLSSNKKTIENKFTSTGNDLGVTGIYIDELTIMVLENKLKDKYKL